MGWARDWFSVGLTLVAFGGCSSDVSGGAGGSGGSTTGQSAGTGDSLGAGTGTGGVSSAEGGNGVSTPTGGTPSGGAATGGSGGTGPTGGLGSGGVTGGATATGGNAPTGGTPSGGAATGGSPAGGAASGGTATGGVATGGTSSGECVPSTCGSHKWACWPMPNPAGAGLPNPASFTDLGGGIVRDDVTCLEWEASPPSDNFVWQDALDYCDGLSLGGASDWRLPTRVEMTSIVDFTQSPAIDRGAFPGAQSGFHKTASDWILTIRQQGAGQGKDFAWAFNLGDGIVSNAYSKATAARLRCVRGNGEGEAPSDPAVAPPDQYSEPATGEVLDNYTGLVWQKDYSDGTMSFSEAQSYCESLGLNGQSWRLPSIRELATLVDEAQVAPSINRTMFPDTQYGSRSNDWYWGSHAARGNASAAWAINFDDGFTGFNAGASGDWNYFTAAWAKCVR